MFLHSWVEIIWEEIVNLSKNISFAFVGQGAAKLWVCKLWEWLCLQQIKPGPPEIGLNGRYFQTYKFEGS